MSAGDPLLARAMGAAEAMLGRLARAAASALGPRTASAVPATRGVVRGQAARPNPPWHGQEKPSASRPVRSVEPQARVLPVARSSLPVPVPLRGRAPHAAEPTVRRTAPRLPLASEMAVREPASFPPAAAPVVPPLRALPPATVPAPPAKAEAPAGVSAPPPGTPATAAPLPQQAPAAPAEAPAAPVPLDEDALARWLDGQLAEVTRRPPRGGTGFDPRLSPGWPGTLQGPWGWGG